MAGIGNDIKEVLEELGTSSTIYKYDGSVFLEKVDFTDYPTNSSEFIRQFFATLTLIYDTVLQPGDIILISGTYYLVTKIATSSFEDSLVDNTAAVYRCNVNGSLKRLSQVRNANYINVDTWTTVKEPLRALQYENKSGNELVMEQDITGLSKESHAVFLPIHVPVKVGDRWYPNYQVTTEYYRVATIDNRRLDNISIVGLQEDTR